MTPWLLQLRTAVAWAIAAWAVGLVLAIGAPFAIGARPLSVLSGSMAPALETGDLTVVRPISPLSARPGDVVTFRDPDRPERLITHRVRAVRAAGDVVAFVTQGDANSVEERWQIARDGEIGRLMYRIPHLGRVLAFTRSPAGRLGLIVVPLLLLGALELARIWRPSPEPDARAVA